MLTEHTHTLRYYHRGTINTAIEPKFGIILNPSDRSRPTGNQLVPRASSCRGQRQCQLSCPVGVSGSREGEQGHLELTLVDARTVIGCNRTRGPEGRERWLILQGEVVSYPERCAEHGDPRSASASASSVSAFFSAFFRSCAAARSTGRGHHCIGIWVFLIQL